MGRLEKIVVLTVLFLIAVILGVSLNSSKDPVEAAGGPLSAWRPAGEAPELVFPDDPAGEPAPILLDPAVEAAPLEDPGAGEIDVAGLEPRAEDGTFELRSAREAEEAEPRTPGLLDATVSVPPEETPAPSAQAAPEEEPRPVDTQPVPLLQTREGLQATHGSDYMIYVWQEGDSFTALADRFYGSRSRTQYLLSANEGRTTQKMTPGEQVLVPAWQIGAQAPSERPGQTTPTARGSIYVVVEGDTLSGISLKVYGKASRWRDIYSANRDVLGDPDSVPLGLHLRIP